MTRIKQLSKGAPHVGCFISAPFSLRDSVFFIFKSWDRVLIDVILGTQLYRMRTSAWVTLDISVFSDTTENLAQKSEIQTIIRREEKNGSSIRFW